MKRAARCCCDPIVRSIRAPRRACAPRSGYFALLAAFTPTLRALGPQFVPHQIQVREPKRGVRAHRVLCQAAIAHLRKAPQALHHQEDVLTARADLRANRIDAVPVRDARGRVGGASVMS